MMFAPKCALLTLLPLGFLAHGCCATACEPLDGCLGGLVIEVDESLVPANARISYQSDTLGTQVLVDDCTGAPASSLLERSDVGEAVTIRELWFGGRPPYSYWLRIEDLGSCEGGSRVVLNVRHDNVPGANGESCDATTLRLPSDLPTDAEVNTCGVALPEGKACLGASSCEVSDWEHECNCMCTAGVWRCTAATLGTVCAETN